MECKQIRLFKRREETYMLRSWTPTWIWVLQRLLAQRAHLAPLGMEPTGR